MSKTDPSNYHIPDVLNLLPPGWANESLLLEKLRGVSEVIFRKSINHQGLLGHWL